ncbi:LacI family DNA-binding transcriptional regulator [Yersinia enterocolitica]|uniref:LacI family DNA-binding transcriptional regulator n=1 Tax=Yersinia enterocolitica TaxID=630 RepID=UPI001C8E6B3E|nr:LacI family DNA-binding transcriptional regulator [Yersinia enterocolitica]MBX9485967.1 LacI family DNA-binding transcriptional regulator [Yersinia enterocolitica]MBX9492192.1 LacI family DNA-binding transcriptional regulator [Yersinia enterocolitica]
MATMKEVAERAGVSIATVSRIINNTAYVEPATRERVEKAMRDVNYRLNSNANSLAKRSGSILGLLTGNLSDPFFARLAKGVEEVARKNGCKLMVCSGAHQADVEKSGLEFLINQGCEAIVAHITRMSELDILRYAAHSPGLVLVNRYLPGIANRCVWLDNFNASKLATSYLLDNGHRKIAYVTADLLIDDKQQRLDGYLSAMGHAGIKVPADWIISVPFNEEGGEVAAQQLLSNPNEFTAVITFNDVMAAGMMSLFHKVNMRLPEQLSIVGFDDIVLARYLHPSLTTIHYPIERMAKRAAALALILQGKGSMSPLVNMFSAELVVRNSVFSLVKNKPI